MQEAHKCILILNKFVNIHFITDCWLRKKLTSIFILNKSAYIFYHCINLLWLKYIKLMCVETNKRYTKHKMNVLCVHISAVFPNFSIYEAIWISDISHFDHWIRELLEESQRVCCILLDKLSCFDSKHTRVHFLIRVKNSLAF